LTPPTVDGGGLDARDELRRTSTIAITRTAKRLRLAPGFSLAGLVAELGRAPSTADDDSLAPQAHRCPAVLAGDVDRCRATVSRRDVVSERFSASRMLRLALGIAVDDDKPPTVAHLEGH
jgi:hypothetical protein